MTTDTCHMTHTHPAATKHRVKASGAVSARTRLAQAHLLLAETRHHCRVLLEASQREAEETVNNARDVASRIIADARSQVTGIDTRDRESSQFSALWAQLEDEQAGDLFFDGFTNREPEDIFNR